jgi:DivIVA domain-containing protein
MEPRSSGDSAGQKTLSPAEVHNVAFKKPPIGKRGYDEEEVDSFLDIVEGELSRLIEANEALKNGAGSASSDNVPDPGLVEENERLTALLAAQEQSEAAREELQAALQEAQERAEALQRELDEAREKLSDDGSAATADASQQAVKILMLAQQTADQHLSAAQAEADRVLTEAQTTAEQLEQESTSEAERRLSEAQAHAETQHRDSAAEAAKRIEEAESHAASILSALETRKASLEQRLEELSNFEREYRSRLKSYLESQLRDLIRGADVDNADAEPSPAEVD